MKKDCGITGWKNYNHAMVPSTPITEDPDTAPICSGQIWAGHRVFFARWTTDFDCSSRTNFWYCIKDTPLDLSLLNAKKRYEIKAGLKNFTVKQINPIEYCSQLFKVEALAFTAYPKKYRPKACASQFADACQLWKGYNVWGAFETSTHTLCGFAVVIESNEYARISIQRVIPSFEKQFINAALVASICFFYQKKLNNNFFICAGAKNVLHETAVYDYLERKFSFRKAYAKLHIAYRPGTKWIVDACFPFKKMLKMIDFLRGIHKLNAVLEMESCCREQECKEASLKTRWV